MDPQQLKKWQENQKRLVRGKEILEMIELDVVSVDLLDLPPLTEYELFVRHFGTSNTTQAYSQCNEDVHFAGNNYNL